MTLSYILCRFLVHLVTAVGSRDKVVRQVGRETLAKVVIELGPTHFGAVLHELRTSLRRGYELQVLGYTVHYILARLVPTLAPSDIDYCAPAIVKLLLDDIFGEIHPRCTRDTPEMHPRLLRASDRQVTARRYLR